MIKTYNLILFLIFISIMTQAQSILTFNQNSYTTHWKENGIDWHIFSYDGFASINENSLQAISNSNLTLSRFSLETNHKLTIFNFQIYVLDLELDINGNWVNIRNNTYIKIIGYDAIGNSLKSQYYYPPDNTNPPNLIGEQLSLNSFNNISKIEFEYDGDCVVLIDNISYIDNGLAYAIPYPGDGTLENPFLISTLDHLKFLSQHRLEWVYNFNQTSDIDAAITQNWDSGQGFLPIGDEANSWWFSGGYDGRGYSISNLHINRPTMDYVGLFRNLIGVVVNLGIVNANIIGGNYTGSLVGAAPPNGITRIEGCYSLNCEITGNRFVGGLIGYSGLYVEEIGYQNVYTLVNSCFSSNCIVKGYSEVGGLIGKNRISAVYNSYCMGSTSTVELLANGTETNAGGLIGYLDYYSEIQNCYSTAQVNYPQLNILGKTGGLIGWKNTNTPYIITNGCFWDKQTSGQTTSAAEEVGKTTTEIKTLSTFTSASWDFTNVWFMIGTDYPNLRSFYNIAPPVQLTAFLEGTYNSTNGNMNNSLAGNIPLSSPFTADSQTVIAIPQNVVDWVSVELRDKNNSSSIKATRSAFLLKNGSIVDLDGVTSLQFGAYTDNYFIAIKHRNHLPIMSKNAVNVTYSATNALTEANKLFKLQNGELSKAIKMIFTE
ncbi:MAG: hypothetical protein HYS24_12300 [Ignavibacteriales bacterium]|nr:hypothetical protein [Ignavibacteriales bacterium]